MALSVLDAVILFVLTVPIVMKYPILPGDTPYWLFGILFFLLFGNIVISVYPRLLGVWHKKIEWIKNGIFLTVCGIVLGGVSIAAMVNRANVAPVWGVHDTVLQQEAAMRYLLVGKNPYKEAYFGTPVESFNYDEPGNTEAVNPALYHFVMPPWYVLFPFVFYYSVRPVVGFFDGRFASFFSIVGLGVMVWHWLGRGAVARIAVSLITFGPGLFDYYLEGRSDVFALFWLVLAVLLFEKNKHIWSAFVLALAVLSKQTIWFALPLYGVLVWTRYHRDVKKWMRVAVTFMGTISVFALPFILWDGKAFLDSVIFYLSGNSAHSYPVSGYGLGMVLKQAGFIGNIHDYYPFVMWQLMLGLPVLYMLIRAQKSKKSPGYFFVGYAIFLGVVWYMSRYFNNSHLGYIAQLFVIGVSKLYEEKELV